MPTKYLLLLSLVSVSGAWAQDAAVSENKQELPIPDGKNIDLEGSIADTNVLRIFENKEVLKPTLGFEDIFLTKESSAVLDIGGLGYPRNELEFVLTNLGVIEKGEADRSGGERIYVGKNEGSTQVLYYEKIPVGKGDFQRGKLVKVYRITVTSQDLLTTLQELKKLIGDVEGMDIRIVGSQVVLDGKILVPRDMRRVLTVVSEFKKKKKPVLNLTEVSPRSLQLLAEKMEEEIAGGKDRQRDIRVKVVNSRFFLEGAVDKKVDRDVGLNICKAYLSEQYALVPGSDGGGVLSEPVFAAGELSQCVNQVRIRAGQPREPDPVISVRVDFVTMKRDYLKLFNFKWAPGVNLKGDVTYNSDAGKITSSFLGTIASLFPVLDTAASHGYARVLKSATLLVRDGVGGDGGAPPEASINENLTIRKAVPIVDPRTGIVTSSVTEVPVKTVVKIKAQSVASSDKLNMDVYAEQTELSDASSNESSDGSSPPSTISNSVSTSLVVANGESAALGGLVVERRALGFVRDPANSGDSQFNLFEVGRSQNITDQKVQFIIFVTPEKLRNPSQGTEGLKRKFRLRK